ncbi:hypothetical protein PUN28_004185 [Cardiocondyla obscurior]
MTDVDLEHLLEQWEANDEPLEPDELPEHLRPLPKIDVTKLNIKKSEDMLNLKKGRSVMMFIDTHSEVTKEQADIASSIWQIGLQNNHITVERYPIENKRYIFMFHDGSQAVVGKNYLLEQPEVAFVTVEGQSYYPPQKKEHFKADESLKKSDAKTQKIEL